MAKFVFRLQSYLNVKEKVEEQVKMEYGRALAALEIEKRKLRELKDEKKRCVAEFREMLAKGVKPDEARTYNGYIELLKERIKAQIAAVEKAEHEAELKRLALVEAMKERKMLETLKENDYEAYLDEAKREEQKSIDEIVSYRYNNRD